jgi:hypothetical protein
MTLPVNLPSNMTAGQTAYNRQFGSPTPGHVGDDGIRDVESVVSAADQRFGEGVAFSAAGVVASMSGSGDLFKGVILASMTREAIRDTVAAHYKAGDQMPLIKKGRVWVWSEQAVTETDAVYVRYTANGALQVGDFRKDADTAKALLLANCKWAGTITAAGMVQLDLNLPA